MTNAKQKTTVLAITLLAACTLIGTPFLLAKDKARSVSHSEAAIALLEKSFAARKQMILLEQKIEDDVNDANENLENKLAQAELDHDEAEQQLDLLTTEHELSGLLIELQEEGLENYDSDVRKLLESHRKLAETSKQYFETRRSNPNSDAEANLEDALESSFDSFEKQRTLLELRIELFFAEEDGDTVLADELRKEIGSVGE